MITTIISLIAPWNPRFDLSDYDPFLVVVAATALTAGAGQQLFYRRWRQTRLEAAIGAFPRIALASLAFGLMHLGPHGTGQAVIDVAQVIVALTRAGDGVVRHDAGTPSADT